MPLVRDNAVALYRQIAELLGNDIAGGRFEPLGRLPSEAEIGARFGVSRVTVRLALGELDRKGLLQRRKGKGTYVAGKQVRHELDTLRSFHESLKMQALHATMRIEALDLVVTPPEVAALLESDAAECAFLERMHLVDGEPIALGRSYLPAALAGLPRADIERWPTYVLLERLSGHKVVHASLVIGVEAADGHCAAALQVADGAPLLVMQRVSHLDDGSAAESSAFYVRPERYKFVLGNVPRKPPSQMYSDPLRSDLSVR